MAHSKDRLYQLKRCINGIIFVVALNIDSSGITLISNTSVVLSCLHLLYSTTVILEYLFAEITTNQLSSKLRRYHDPCNAYYVDSNLNDFEAQKKIAVCQKYPRKSLYSTGTALPKGD
jgi:hypothetical protein